METLIRGAQKLGLKLSLRQTKHFSIYYQELIDWNQRLNLTAITDYEEVQIKHFLDSLTVILALKQVSKDFSLIDIGTGAGLPGIPLKILLPNIKLVLLEATNRKATFLHHIIKKLGLENAEVVIGRAEEAAHQEQYRERFDLVLSRAVAPLPTLVELTLPFCTIGGRFISQKKGDTNSEVEQAMEAIRLLGGKLDEITRIKLVEFTDERRLIVINKIISTPEQYPRRSGIPQKRPLLDKQFRQ